jgi:hypothetical protein
VKRGKCVNKSPLNVFDSLPWKETEKKMEDLPIHPSISEMWRSLFDNDGQTPFQKTMVTVNHDNFFYLPHDTAMIGSAGSHALIFSSKRTTLREPIIGRGEKEVRQHGDKH